ncbi:HTH-type transcriptional regulatory protein GabR [Oceanobacillus oncorhynchi subsp. incaldanensis]|uniref:MocR-like transcriptional regulator GabR n=1 Tax=Oceanobacillus oncorhynchi TaxID=545501 RepID=UPI001B264E5C|nr:PLP-dependent aminotransferase family protein [Oceanobacillus oncorhynchi]GIO19687.1 HTH-type transcriptional regulatory protein GabR [Oceanobacillus oncorhynchi subsp. incaldanensis]
MFFLTLDKNGESKFKYQQIYDGIKEKALQGKLKAHEKLPSKRQLANELKVSINTITTAYEQLLAEGYIYTVERKGFYVENIDHIVGIENELNNKLPNDLKEEQDDKGGWLSLSHMTSDLLSFPFNEWLKCQQKVIKNHKKDLSELAHPQGPYKVRKTISRMIGLTRGVICEPEQIVIGAGTPSLVGQLMELQKLDSVVAVEDPGYSRFYTLLKKMDFVVKPISLDEKGAEIEQVAASKAKFLFVTPSHQFPTGIIMPVSRRIELLNWAAEADDRYIVEDDYDSEFKYETDSIPSLQSIDRNHRVIYTGTFSKTLFPGIRISYMVLPPKLLREYRKHSANLMQYSNLIALFTLHYFIESGAYAKHVKRMSHHYELKRKLLINLLKKRFKHKVEIMDIPAGLHFRASFVTEKTYKEVIEKARQVKLEIYSMKRFMLEYKYEEDSKVDMILGFANIKEEDIEEAVDRLYQCIM